MSVLAFLRRRLARAVTDPVVPPCPCCDARLPVEPAPHQRYFCPGCGKDFGARLTDAGRWLYDLEPLRYKVRDRTAS